MRLFSSDSDRTINIVTLVHPDTMQASLQVEVTKEEVLVSNYATTDHEIVSYFSTTPKEKRSDAFRVAVRAGIMALKTIGIAERVDYIEKEFNKMEDSITQEIEGKFGENGTTTKILGEYFGEDGYVSRVLKERLGKNSDLIRILVELFGEEGRVERTLQSKLGENGELDRILKELFGEDGKIVRELFDPHTKGTPLYSLREELNGEFRDLREKLGIKEEVEKERERGTAKGKDFEAEIDDLLSPLCNLFGDRLFNVSNEIGAIKGSKKGDFISDLSGSHAKIVIEAKDSPYSSNAIKKEMDQALENRKANYGVFVSKYVEDLDESIGWFNEYDERYVVVAIHSKDETISNSTLLEIAYKWARIKLMHGERSKTPTVDTLDITRELSDIKTQVERFKHTRTQCSNIDKSVRTIRKDLDEIQNTIIEKIGGILRAMELST